MAARYLAILTIALAVAFITPARAETVCGPAEALLKAVGEKGYHAQASAIDARGNLLLFLANSAGSWGEIGIRKDGLACVLDGGEEWQAAGQGGQL